MELTSGQQERQETFLHRLETLDIQGATNVAIESLRFLETELDNADLSRQEQTSYTTSFRDRVLTIRPTEPMFKNLVNRFITDLKASRDAELGHLIQTAETANQHISEHADELIQDGMTVLTHCHSSSSTAMLISASEHADIQVYNTETRPKYQGRTTSQELVEAGIDTTQIVDSAVYSILDNVDLVLVGADAVTPSHLYNKIGTSQIAFIAEAENIPFHVATSLLKYSSQEIEIEQRSEEEVWPEKPENLRILNPAFDPTDLSRVSRIWAEQGSVSPDKLPETAQTFMETI